jgi:hypothetical protein
LIESKGRGKIRAQDPREVLGLIRNRPEPTGVEYSVTNFYLFLIPSGILYQQVQHLLAEDETPEESRTPVMKHRRPGPKHPNYGIPTDLWPTVVHRVVDQQEPLRTVAAYRVSHETILRIMLHV